MPICLYFIFAKKVVVARSRLFCTVNTINGKLVCPYLNFLHILYIPTLSPLLSDTQEHIPVMCYFFNSTGKVARAGLSNSYLSESNMKFKIRLSIYLSIYLSTYLHVHRTVKTAVKVLPDLCTFTF